MNVHERAKTPYKTGPCKKSAAAWASLRRTARTAYKYDVDPDLRWSPGLPHAATRGSEDAP